MSAPLPPVVAHPHVELSAEGGAYVSGTTIPVRRLYSWHRCGTPVDTLIRRYPQLGPARVLDALSWAYDNLERVLADLERERWDLDGPAPARSEEPDGGRS